MQLFPINIPLLSRAETSNTVAECVWNCHESDTAVQKMEIAVSLRTLHYLRFSICSLDVDKY